MTRYNGSEIKTTGLIGKFRDPSVGHVLEKLSANLSQRGLRVLFDQETAAHVQNPVPEALPLEKLAAEIDLAIVVGGDGTILHVARTLAEHDVPLVGVNLGRLGFLADIPPDELFEHIDDLLGGKYRIEPRAMLSAELIRDGEVIGSGTALNDVVIYKGDISRLIDIETWIDDQFVNHSRGDGVIVATPTGSTAYALSAGGPILHPELPAMALVPVCPHTLSNRPIVVRDQSAIRIVLARSSQQAQTTLDGQICFPPMQLNDAVVVRRSKHDMKLIRPCEHTQYDVLRAKLNWAQ